jgi:murein L,D-transpeptidase YcbB/YkuD
MTMHGLRDRIRTGTAIALVLSLACAAPAFAADPDVEALIPIPEAADVPPPTAADVGGTATATVPAAPTTTSTVALPGPSAKAPAETQPAATAPAQPVATLPAQPAATAPAATAPAETAQTPAPAPDMVATADQPTADALRELVTGKLARMTDRKADRAAIEAFYSGRNYAPLWIANGAANDRAKAAISRLNRADEDAMDPADYPTPVIKAGAEPAALADAELRLTLSAMTFARQAMAGRVHYSRVSGDITYNQTTADPAQVLANLASASDVDAALESYQPPHAEYKALRGKLAELRGSKADPDAGRIAHGPVLELRKDKRGNTILMQDERVTALRDKLGLDPVKGDTFYDKPLADAVAAFQKGKGLRADGKLTAATVDTMNGRTRNAARDADIVMANMERWRWVPRDLGKAHVVLNIPDYTLQVYKDGVSIWKTRVVVGQPAKPTPLLSETMKYITVNPTWNVPPSIIYNEYLPALQQDPTVLKRMGLNLTQNKDGSVHISQPPGEANALGRIRFNFPNKFLVYQHDTPDKYLFSRDKRAYSHGCMRVQDPAKYAEVMTGLGLPGGRSYTQEQIKGMYGRSEIDLRFTTPIWVHITYQTAFVDEHGKLQFRDDVYGRDQRLLAALKNEDKRVAEIPIERAQPNYSRPAVRLPDGVGSSDYSSGPSFFERLFGGPSRPEPQGRQQRRQTRADAVPGPARDAWMNRTR